MGKVYLIGAGPGDPELITLKGLKMIRLCDAIVYDRLGTEGLLDEIPKDAKRIYVGKQAGSHYKTQPEINEILVETAKKYERVVRLKGGDSFVFGRGGEEIEVLKANGIDYELVPGITSAVSVPELAGIPVTHRGLARSFHVITGHTKEGEGLCRYETLAKEEGTLVFLMGLSAVRTISEGLVAAGKSENTPAAIISSGSTDSQMVVRGTLKDIADKCEAAHVPSPAIIVVGEVTALDFKGTIKRRKAGVIATPRLFEKMAPALEKKDVQAKWICRMDVVPTEHMAELSKEIENIEDYGWVMFTSQNAVQLFFDEMADKELDIRSLANVKFAAIGSGTAKKLRDYGIKADFVPEVYDARHLSEAFIPIYNKDEDKKVLIPRAARGNKVLSKNLEEAGIPFAEIPIYDVEGNLTEDLTDALFESLDTVMFLSASGVKAFAEKVAEAGLALPSSLTLSCIGRETAEALRKCGYTPFVTADQMDIDGLIQKTFAYWEEK